MDSVIDTCLPGLLGIRTSDTMKPMLGLYCLGKSDFEANNPFRYDRLLKETLGFPKIWGKIRIRDVL